MFSIGVLSSYFYDFDCKINKKSPDNNEKDLKNILYKSG